MDSRCLLKCPKCEAVVQETTDFCVKCGEHLVVPCPSCQSMNHLSHVYCSRCGAFITVEKVIATHEIDGNQFPDDSKVTKPVSFWSRYKAFLIAGVVLVILSSFAIMYFSSNYYNYLKAEKAYSSGDYNTAIFLFNGLGEYKDSNRRAKIIDWEQHGLIIDGNIIWDTNSNLEWRVAPDVDYDVWEACSWVNSLEGEWHMPSLDQLRSLYDSGVRLEKWPFALSGVWVWADDVYYQEYSNFRFSDGHTNWCSASLHCGRAMAVRHR